MEASERSASAAARAWPRVLGPRARPPRHFGASPRFRGAGGHAAPLERPPGAEPRPSDSERARRPAGSAAAEAFAAADGRSGVPAGHTRAGTTRRPRAQRTAAGTCRRGLAERRVRAAALPRTPPPAGLHSSGRSDSGGGSRARDRPEARRRTGARRAAWLSLCAHANVATISLNSDFPVLKI